MNAEFKDTSGPDGAAAAISFLCSDKASFITGAVLSVDAGNSIGTFESGLLGAAEGVVVR
jgi:3-oxoacyl-[acyl-carrier protein] reductase